MPSNVVHNYFGKLVKEGLPNEIKKIIESNEKAYCLGAQGPDLMFYLKFEKEPLNLLGNYIHESFNTAEIFKISADYQKKVNSKVLFAFLLGQLCHYAIDAVVHPYVYMREKNMPAFYPKSYHKHIHVTIESAFDYIFLRDYIKVNTVSFKSYKYLDIQKEARREIAAYYSNAVAPYFDMELPTKVAEKSIKLMRGFLKYCDDTTGIKYILLRLAEVVCRLPRTLSPFIRPRKEREQEDWLNLKCNPFPKYNKGEEICHDTFDEQIERAKADAEALIINFYGYISGNNDIDKTLYSRNYCGTIAPDR